MKANILNMTSGEHESIPEVSCHDNVQSNDTKYRNMYVLNDSVTMTTKGDQSSQNNMSKDSLTERSEATGGDDCSNDNKPTEEHTNDEDNVVSMSSDVVSDVTVSIGAMSITEDNNTSVTLLSSIAIAEQDDSVTQAGRPSTPTHSGGRQSCDGESVTELITSMEMVSLSSEEIIEAENKKSNKHNEQKWVERATKDHGEKELEMVAKGPGRGDAVQSSYGNKYIRIPVENDENVEIKGILDDLKTIDYEIDILTHKPYHGQTTENLLIKHNDPYLPSVLTSFGYSNMRSPSDSLYSSSSSMNSPPMRSPENYNIMSPDPYTSPMSHHSTASEDSGIQESEDSQNIDKLAVESIEKHLRESVENFEKSHPVKRGRGRPKGSKNKNTPKVGQPKIQPILPNIPQAKPPSPPCLLPLILPKPDPSVQAPVVHSNDTEIQKERLALANACRHVSALPREKLQYIDDDGDTLLTIGIVKDRHMFRALVERLHREKLLADIINKPNNKKQTPLYLAVVTTKLDLVKFLLEKGAEPNQWIGGSNEMKLLLHVAAENGESHLDILRTLLDASSIQINQKTPEQKTPLYCAVEKHATQPIKNYHHIVKLLMERGAKIVPGPNDKTPLHILAETLDLAFLKFMIGLMPNVEQQKNALELQDSNGNTCLHIAFSKICDNVTKDTHGKIRQFAEYLLIDMTVNYAIKNHQNETARTLSGKMLEDIFEKAEKIRRKNKKKELGIPVTTAVTVQPVTIAIVTVPNLNPSCVSYVPISRQSGANALNGSGYVLQQGPASYRPPLNIPNSTILNSSGQGSSFTMTNTSNINHIKPSFYSVSTPNTSQYIVGNPSTVSNVSAASNQPFHRNITGDFPNVCVRTDASHMTRQDIPCDRKHSIPDNIPSMVFDENAPIVNNSYAQPQYINQQPQNTCMGYEPYYNDGYVAYQPPPYNYNPSMTSGNSLPAPKPGNSTSFVSDSMYNFGNTNNSNISSDCFYQNSLDLPLHYDVIEDALRRDDDTESLYRIAELNQLSS